VQDWFVAEQGPGGSSLIELPEWSIAYNYTFVNTSLDKVLIPRLSIKYGIFLDILADT